MIVLSTIKEIQEKINKSPLHPLGLVPTMGALHDGHISLVRTATTDCPRIVISIFVNPTQFNDKEDLKRYPRTPDADLSLLKKVLRNDDIVFMPDAKEIYPSEDKRVFHFGNLDHVMEALNRPGHFNGVAQVVSRLFEIVHPDTAYFGLKDFQQVAVVKELVRQLGYKIRIKSCPIMREADGLALSSRNTLLEPEIRKKAPIIYKTISKASEMISDTDIPEIKEYVKNRINSTKGFTVEYFEIADDQELVTVSSRDEIKKDRQYFGCIAVKAGRIRLIDNIQFPLV